MRTWLPYFFLFPDTPKHNLCLQNLDALDTFCEGLFFYLDVYSLPTSLSGVRNLILVGSVLGVMRLNFRGTNH